MPLDTHLFASRSIRLREKLNLSSSLAQLVFFFVLILLHISLDSPSLLLQFILTFRLTFISLLAFLNPTFRLQKTHDHERPFLLPSNFLPTPNNNYNTHIPPSWTATTPHHFHNPGSARSQSILLIPKTIFQSTPPGSNAALFFAQTIARQRDYGQPVHVNLFYGSPEIFRYYMNCVLTNQATIEGTMYAPSDTSSTDVLTAYCHAYLFAARLQDCTTANLIIDALIDYAVRANALPSCSHVEIVYEEAEAESPLRCLMVDMWAYGAKYGTTATSAHRELPWQFLDDVFEEKMRAEARGSEKKVREAFDFAVVRAEEGRHHSWNELHPRPEEMKLVLK